VLLACSCAAAVFSFWLARAGWLFQQDTAASVPAAVDLVPFNAEYLARLAAWKPKEKIALLHRAVERNPFEFESWIQLGFASEFQSHDRASAERYYLQAAAVNKMFLPKWTLTNFYFRQGEAEQFFRWAESTLAISPYSPEPVFVQMWLMSQDAERIASAIPDRPRTLLPYAWFLSNTHERTTLGSIVQRLITAVGSKDPHVWGRDDLLATIQDRLLDQGDRTTALQIWANLVRGRWLDRSIPNVDHPLTNGDFRKPAYGHGFDWMPLVVKGVRVDQPAGGDSARLEFSGEQPEHDVLLQQYLPLQPDDAYEFRWQTETQIRETPSGLTWHLKPVSSSGEDASSTDLLAGGSWLVRAPRTSEIALLTLEYSRPIGELRLRGVLTLRSVSASRVSTPSSR
jgi:hypothetical protein